MTLRFVDQNGVAVTGTGNCALVNAALGQCSYQWTLADMQALPPSTYHAYAIAKMPGDMDYRAFDLGLVVLLYLAGGAFVSTQDVNVQQINGQNISTTYNGMTIPNGAQPVVLVIPAGQVAQRVGAQTNDIADLATLLASVGAIGDSAWSGSGSGSEIAILKKIVAELAGTLGITGNVTEINSAAILADLVTLAGAISANKMQINAASLPLPTGASQEGGNLATIASLLTTLVTQTTTIAATISSGQSLSSEIDLGGYRNIAIQMPSSWDTANLTFQGSTVSSGTFQNIYDSAGNELTLIAAASHAIADIPELAPFRYIKIRSGTSGTPVNQSANRTITVIAKG
jgi:hypothetical protein